MFDDPWAHGYDGWYYVLQVRGLLAGEGRLFDDHSLVFPILVLFGAVFRDVIVGNKVAAAVFGGVTAFGGALAAYRWTGVLRAGIICGLWWAISPLHLGVSAEFVKNSCGAAVLALLLAALPDCERDRRTLILIVALSLLGPMVHKLTGVMGLIAAGSYGVTRTLEGRLSPKWIAAGTILGIVTVALLGLLRPEDLTRLIGGQSGSGARLAMLTGGRLDGLEQAEVLVVHLAPLGIAAIALSQRALRPFGLATLPLSIVSVAPGLPFGWDLTAWRLLLMGFLPVGLLLGAVAAQPRWGLWIAGGLVGVGVWYSPANVAAHQARSPDYVAWASARSTLQEVIPARGRVVAHRGLCGFVWAEVGIVCENFQPTGPLEGWWRVAYGFGAQRLAPYTTPEYPPVTLIPGYTLVHEPAWRRFVAAEGDRFRLTRDARNPYRPRPSFVYGPGAETPEADRE